MRLVITQNITLDGVIEAITDWFSPAGDDTTMADIRATLQEQTANEDGLLLGRHTFEDFRSYWPKQIHDTTGITDHLNRVQKYVVSQTLDDPAWERTTILSHTLEDDVCALKAQPGADLCVTGSISLCHALIEADLVDEYRLFTYPIVLGRGRRLFPDNHTIDSLALVDATPFQSGVVLLTYSRR